MTAEMIERVAKAIFESGFHPFDRGAASESKWLEWPDERRRARAAATAAIEAMRECTSAMHRAGEIAIEAGAGACHAYAAMVSAALAQAGEAGTAETSTKIEGSVHEHAVREADAP